MKYLQKGGTEVVLRKRCSWKIPQNSQKNTFVGVSFLIILLKKTLIQLFSCEFCKIFKNTFYIEHIWAAVSLAAICKQLHFPSV